VPSAPCGVYDLTIDTTMGVRYLAIFANGFVGFVSRSSAGRKDLGYVTTMWSVGCEGAVTAGVVGGAEFFFYVDAFTDLVHAWEYWGGQGQVRTNGRRGAVRVRLLGTAEGDLEGVVDDGEE